MEEKNDEDDEGFATADNSSSEASAGKKREVTKKEAKPKETAPENETTPIFGNRSDSKVAGFVVPPRVGNDKAANEAEDLCKETKKVALENAKETHASLSSSTKLIVLFSLKTTANGYIFLVNLSFYGETKDYSENVTKQVHSMIKGEVRRN